MIDMTKTATKTMGVTGGAQTGETMTRRIGSATRTRIEVRSKITEGIMEAPLLEAGSDMTSDKNIIETTTRIVMVAVDTTVEALVVVPGAATGVIETGLTVLAAAAEKICPEQALPIEMILQEEAQAAAGRICQEHGLRQHLGDLGREVAAAGISRGHALGPYTSAWGRV